MSGRITALQAQKRNSQRVNVFLDGKFAFGLARITAAWLSVGQELSDEKIAQLQSEDAREVAYQQALRLLERRPRSHKEIQQHLSRAGVAEDVIQEVLQRLSRSDLASDEKFASAWVENRQEFRPRSRKALAFEMRQKGISPDIIDRALDKISDQDEEELAYQAASRQARKYARLDWPEFRQKMVGFLARRGFNYETSAAATQRAWQDLPASNDEYDSEAFSSGNNTKFLTNERRQDERR
jgi:regulatory protein